MARRQKGQFKPTLLPFLNILTCTAGVLAFIIVAVGLISILAPSVVITHRTTQDAFRKHPIYLECQPDYLIIHPEKTKIPTDSLFVDNPPFERFLDKMTKNAGQQYVVFTIYPNGEITFRKAREAIKKRNDQIAELGKKIDIGYEPLNKNWRLIFKKE